MMNTSVLDTLNEMFLSQEGRELSEAELVVLCGAWDRQTYEEMEKNSKFSINYLKRDIGPKLWKILSKVLDEEVGKVRFRQVLEQKLSLKGFTLEEPFQASLTSEILDLSLAQKNNLRDVVEGASVSLQINEFQKDLKKIEQALESIIHNESLEKSRFPKSIIIQSARRFLKICSSNIEDLMQGEIFVSGTVRTEQVVELLEDERVRQENYSVLATSYGDIYKWWNHPDGWNFMRKNIELRKAGNKVERIFILPNRQVALDKLGMGEIIKKQSDSGIDVKIILEEQLKKKLDDYLKVNLLVCENWFTTSTQIFNVGKVMDDYDLNGRIYATDEKIKFNMDLFNQLSRIADSQNISREIIAEL